MATSVSASLAYLNALTITPRDAIDALEQTSSSVQLLALFEHYFPKQFAKYKSFSAGNANAAVGEFLRLIEKDMFPLDSDFLEEQLSEMGGPQFVPILPVNEDWWEMAIGDLCPFDRTVLTVCGAIGEQADDEPPDVSGSVPDYRKLKRSCTGPLADLPLAIKFLFHDTDNGWCNLVWEQGMPMLPWDIKTLDMLTKSWKEAREILRRVSAVLKWVHGSSPRLDQVKKIVVAAMPKAKAKPQVNRPLVETLID